MSPEDDLQTISETINNGWNSKSYKLNGNGNGAMIDKKTNGINSNGYTNSENGRHVNGEAPTWLPLLAKDAHDQENGHRNANNNKWSAPSLANTKYGWEELPQDDDHGLSKTQLNGLHVNGKNGNGKHNGYSDKNEQESLTGVIRQPELDELSSCGIGLCQPKWAQYFASTHVFMVIFLFAWVLQVSLLFQVNYPNFKFKHAPIYRIVWHVLYWL